MNIKSIISKVEDSFFVLKKNYKILLLGVMIELLFVIVLGFFIAPLNNGLINNFEQLGGEIIEGSPETGNEIVNVASSSEYFRNILILGAIIGIIAYLLYCAFQGVVWKFCFNLSGKKEKYKSYIKKFFLVNLFWGPLFAFYILINFLFSFVDLVGERIEPGGVFFMEDATNIILFIIIYFAFISYIKLDKEKVWKSIKESFRIGIKKIKWVVVMYLIMVLVFMVINYVLFLIGSMSYYIFVFVGVLIVMPSMLWARVFMKKVVDEL